MDLFQGLKSKDMGGYFHWLNEPGEWGFSEKGLEITAPSSTDFFNDPEGPNKNNTAPYLYTPAKGDFELTTRVNVDMSNTFDAGCLMIMKDCDTWGKFCYENWINEPSIVSVVTRNLSDDCPSLRIGKAKPYLKVLRSGDCFGFHYSLDAKNWVIIRFFHMGMPEEIMVGVSAQSPIGKDCNVCFEFFDLELKEVSTAKFVK